ncbi:arginine--tRNA ligase [Pelodictyon luteolum]|uniref:Arginine--tRNA ligase n=1 Tax=Chlorobium luteolum (strain DSM 273 / BCRC 81028 / 2530) TaxID=319225 RepID=SYR_CHLL3|nr:arginine--tRNA ligase [Pelodictyon luteolum]Q3B147.1 RecName: Full=Arginine--tRNA ligase; AltName: Full=Arginyl-tRNA synthetase; Short=ArgRS [Pelodictyon luteolum DSM 273]ABB24934.1 arginyl-tRNA synthetase [Pelodictyon luteolum DSM 273]
MQSFLVAEIQNALRSASVTTGQSIIIEKPTSPKFGDYATNIAFLAAKELKRNPRQLAEELTGHFRFPEGTVTKTEVAGPGFINFFMEPAFIMQSAERVFREGAEYGKGREGQGKTAIVEYVSANPTGPLTIGRGRGGVLGDCIANLAEAQGYHVNREYYFNDAGRQMQILGESVRYRYMELCGRTIDFPDTHYKGGYIGEIAEKIHSEHGEDLLHVESIEPFRSEAESIIFSSIQKTLGRLGIVHDSFFNEHTLYTADLNGISPNQNVIDRLREKGFIGEYDGATWFLTTKLGQEKDKVLIKSSGEPSYRLPDIAYHVTKYARGFDMIINVFGADHIDEYPDVLEALKILGHDTAHVRIAINQFVTTTVNGETVKMSTRKGNADLLDDLIDDVGPDATRLFFIMRSKDSHLNFDVELAKKQSKDNPVFYLQYAHARICSLLRLAWSEIGFDAAKRPEPGVLMRLTTPEELQLAFGILDFGEASRSAFRMLEPQKMVDYMHSIAELFHRFYQECPILKAEPEIAEARLFLAVAVRQVLQNGFRILGISAPESM